MPTTPQQLIASAARQMDLRGDVDAAERALREAIELARENRQVVSEIQAMTFLGEVLLTMDRATEAFALFERVLAHSDDPDIEPDLIDHEIRIAREHLGREPRAE